MSHDPTAQKPASPLPGTPDVPDMAPDREGQGEGQGEGQDMTARLHALREAPMDPPHDAFMASLHMKLVQAGPPPEPGLADRIRALFQLRPGMAWPTVGMATGVAAFALLTLVQGGTVPVVASGTVPGGSGENPSVVATTTAGTVLPAPPPGQPAEVDEPPAHAVPASKVAVIRLNFSADVDVEAVDFEVTLPEGLSFWSEGEMLAEHSVMWQQGLVAGDNAIPIAVRGDRPGRFAVTAVADVAGQRIEQKLWLEVTGG